MSVYNQQEIRESVEKVNELPGYEKIPFFTGVHSSQVPLQSPCLPPSLKHIRLSRELNGVIFAGSYQPSANLKFSGENELCAAAPLERGKGRI